LSSPLLRQGVLHEIGGLIISKFSRYLDSEVDVKGDLEMSVYKSFEFKVARTYFAILEVSVREELSQRLL
jgi:hypothetical protein